MKACNLYIKRLHNIRISEKNTQKTEQLLIRCKTISPTKKDIQWNA